MSTVISVHSFRGGTGKSNTTANVAAKLAAGGARVCVIDTDIQSPGVHVLFGLEETPSPSLNDFLWGRNSIVEAAHDMTDRIRADTEVAQGGVLFLVPSSIKASEIAKVLREGYDVGDLNDGFRSLSHDLELDYLLIDTHPGINEETLLSITISDVLLLILRPDRQDFQGTAVTVDVARRLDVPDLFLVLNKVPSGVDTDDLRSQMKSAYDSEAIAFLPLSEDVVRNASGGLFSITSPDHPWSLQIEEIVRRIQG